MNTGELFNLLIVAMIVLGPALAKLGKKKAAGTANGGASKTALRGVKRTVDAPGQVPARPAAAGGQAGNVVRMRPIERRQHTLRTQGEVADQQAAAQPQTPETATEPAPLLQSTQPRQRVGGTLQRAVVLTSILDPPTGLRQEPIV